MLCNLNVPSPRHWKQGKSLEPDNNSNRYVIVSLHSRNRCKVNLLALAVYVCSPAAYEVLKSYRILQLPSKSTLQSYTGAFLHEPGVCAESIIKQVAQYNFV